MSDQAVFEADHVEPRRLVRVFLGLILAIPRAIWTFQGERTTRRSLGHAGGRRTAALLATFACGGCALVAAGCGSSGSSGSSSGGSPNLSRTSPHPVLVAAVRSTSVAGFRMRLDEQLSSPALPNPISITLNGAFDLRSRSGTFSLAFDLGNINPRIVAALGSGTVPVHGVLKWPIAYYRFPSALMTLIGADKPWVKHDLSTSAASATSPTNDPFSSDPTETLEYLRAVSGTITAVGQEQIGGLQTTHYRTTIDLNKVPDAVSESRRGAARQSVAKLMKLLGKSTLPADVWIDGHQLVRQMQMSYDGNVDGQSVNVMLTMDIPEYGRQAPAVLPPANQVSTSGAGAP